MVWHHYVSLGITYALGLGSNEFEAPKIPQWLSESNSLPSTYENLREEVDFHFKNVRDLQTDLENDFVLAFEHSANKGGLSINKLMRSQEYTERALMFWKHKHDDGMKRDCEQYLKNMKISLRKFINTKGLEEDYKLPTIDETEQEYTRDTIPASENLSIVDTEDMESRWNKLNDEYHSLVKTFGKNHDLCCRAKITLSKLQETWDEDKVVDREILVTLSEYEAAKNVINRKERMRLVASEKKRRLEKIIKLQKSLLNHEFNEKIQELKQSLRELDEVRDEDRDSEFDAKKKKLIDEYVKYQKPLEEIKAKIRIQNMKLKELK